MLSISFKAIKCYNCTNGVNERACEASNNIIECDLHLKGCVVVKHEDEIYKQCMERSEIIAINANIESGFQVHCFF